MQTQASSSLSNRVTIFTVARNIIALNGPSGLYRGFAACVIGIAPEKGIKLAVNDGMREYFYSKHPNRPIQIYEEIISGTAAGLLQLIATVPYEHVKIKLQMQINSSVKRRTAIQIIKDLGLFKLYIGFTPTLFRDVPFCILFFVSYIYIYV